MYSCFLHILLHLNDLNALVSSLPGRALTETLANKYTYEVQILVIIRMEIRALSALRGPFLDARRIFLFVSCVTVPARRDLAR